MNNIKLSNTLTHSVFLNGLKAASTLWFPYHLEIMEKNVLPSIFFATLADKKVIVVCYADGDNNYEQDVCIYESNTDQGFIKNVQLMIEEHNLDYYHSVQLHSGLKYPLWEQLKSYLASVLDGSST